MTQPVSEKTSVLVIGGLSKAIDTPVTNGSSLGDNLNLGVSARLANSFQGGYGFSLFYRKFAYDTYNNMTPELNIPNKNNGWAIDVLLGKFNRNNYLWTNGKSWVSSLSGKDDGFSTGKIHLKQPDFVHSGTETKTGNKETWTTCESVQRRYGGVEASIGGFGVQLRGGLAIYTSLPLVSTVRRREWPHSGRNFELFMELAIGSNDDASFSSGAATLTSQDLLMDVYSEFISSSALFFARKSFDGPINTTTDQFDAFINAPGYGEENAPSGGSAMGGAEMEEVAALQTMLSAFGALSSRDTHKIYHRGRESYSQVKEVIKAVTYTSIALAGMEQKLKADDPEIADTRNDIKPGDKGFMTAGITSFNASLAFMANRWLGVKTRYLPFAEFSLGALEMLAAGASKTDLNSVNSIASAGMNTLVGTTMIPFPANDGYLSRTELFYAPIVIDNEGAAGGAVGWLNDFEDSWLGMGGLIRSHALSAGNAGKRVHNSVASERDEVPISNAVSTNAISGSIYAHGKLDLGNEISLYGNAGIRIRKKSDGQVDAGITTHAEIKWKSLSVGAKLITNPFSKGDVLTFMPTVGWDF